MRQRHKVPVKGLSEKIAEATPPPPNENKVPFLALLTTRAFFGEGQVYAGTVSPHVVARRRAANKRARIARRAARR